MSCVRKNCCLRIVYVTADKQALYGSFQFFNSLLIFSGKRQALCKTGQMLTVAFTFIMIQIIFVENSDFRNGQSIDRMDKFKVFVGTRKGSVEDGEDKLCFVERLYRACDADSFDFVICGVNACRIDKNKANLSNGSFFFKIIAGSSRNIGNDGAFPSKKRPLRQPYL